MDHISHKVPEFAVGLGFLKSQLTIPVAEKGNGEVDVIKFVFQKLNHMIPLFSVHYFSDFVPDEPILVYFINFTGKYLTLLKSLAVLIFKQPAVIYRL
jgi:hypothetical protein